MGLAQQGSCRLSRSARREVGSLTSGCELESLACRRGKQLESCEAFLCKRTAPGEGRSALSISPSDSERAAGLLHNQRLEMQLPPTDAEGSLPTRWVRRFGFPCPHLTQLVPGTSELPPDSPTCGHPRSWDCFVWLLRWCCCDANATRGPTTPS